MKITNNNKDKVNAISLLEWNVSRLQFASLLEDNKKRKELKIKGWSKQEKKNNQNVSFP